MVCDLIIDGNFILNRSVFALSKNNLLFGALESSLHQSIDIYRKLYPFSKIYFVSDSKKNSWRKSIYKDYKSNRKKDNSIEWEYVYQVYDQFKGNLHCKNIKLLESDSVEGDDWISHITMHSNSKNRSTFIITNDYDIKQLIKFDMDPLYINFMSNEMFSNKKIFLPTNYKLFLSHLYDGKTNNIFDLNNNDDFYEFMTSIIEKSDVVEIDRVESIFIKIVSGDRSDNISSVWEIESMGKTRGIAQKGAHNIYLEYVKNFGDPLLEDPDLSENIADIICEKKKLSKSLIPKIKSNIDLNRKLIILDSKYLPDFISKKIKENFDNGS